MSTPNHPRIYRLLLVVVAQLSAAYAAETPDSPKENSVSVSSQFSSVSGDKAAFQEKFQRRSGFDAGIETLRLRNDFGNWSLALDGAAFPADGNFNLAGKWSHADAPYFAFGYTQFRTYYDGTGGFFVPTQTAFALYDERLHVDRGLLWFEAGVAAEDRPRAFLRYELLTRRGKKPTTEWGDTNLTGVFGTRSVVPAFLQLNETRHIVSVEVSQDQKPTTWAAGGRYEHSALDNARVTPRRPNESASRIAQTTDRTSTDLLSAHAFAEHEFHEQFRASAGALVTKLDTALDGNRIYGASYDPVFDPVFARRQAGDLGFLNLDGGTHMKQYVFNLNGVYLPAERWSVRTGVRYEHLNYDDLATFIATNVQNSLVTSLQNNAGASQKQENRLTETAEVRYTGKSAWTYSLRGEWNQASGNLDERLFVPDNGTPLITRATDYYRQQQKYTLAANWYARPGLTVSSEYYFKLQLNNYAATIDSTPAGSADRYPAFITNQDFTLHDFNIRASWRPSHTVSLITRYDAQFATTTTSFAGIPKLQNNRTTAHIVSQSVTWTPFARLYVIGSGNMVFNQIATPAASLILNSDNNYFNASVTAAYALGKKTDLQADFSHYRARNFVDISTTSLPYGAEARTDTASLTYVVRQSQLLIYTFKYTYAMNRDATSGGRNNFNASLLYAKAQLLF
ncbi:MAG: hypothetical protein QM790_11945 [Nibricoccus sp.]